MKIYLEPHDTLHDISRIFDIPLEILEDSIPENREKCSLEKDFMEIPGLFTLPYSVRKGDNLEKLERIWRMPAGAIERANRLNEQGNLKAGQLIWRPYRILSPILVCKMDYNSHVLERDIGFLKKAYPFIRFQVIGKSALGKPIYELLIGRGKRRIHFNASFHANEWITTGILMDLVNSYSIGLTNRSHIYHSSLLRSYNEIELSIVPMVNPDGVDLVLLEPPLNSKDNVVSMNKGKTDFSGWKANIRGIDLNNQFPAHWEIEKERKEPKSPSARDYPGVLPLSEPEAKAMAELTIKRKFDMVIAFHSQGEEFYWGYNNREPAEAGEIATLIAEASGYRPVRTIDSHAGFKDWFIQEFQKPGFTIELGKGINPLPLSQYDSIFRSVSGLFFSLLEVRKN
ncbi:M14 family metallopeptidase [Bacillus sp. EB01]|uniref:M14 family metallopeptidase n=1 Tax=Bacillus sp. EB01 TaxID=1347086 RepID=UPI0005C56CBA|nr:M14 family metallopeptidase [Bacillus sp. EB01]